jgi:hypothetical protein
VSVLAKADKKVHIIYQSRVWVLCKTASGRYEVAEHEVSVEMIGCSFNGQERAIT